MADDPVRERVTEIVSIVFGVDPSLDDEPHAAPAADWDSLHHIEIILAVEEEFGISITEEEFATLRSIDSISAHLNRQRAPR